MILGFKEKFVEPILNGSKIHTIRVDKNRRWNGGRIIHFSTNVRTLKQNQFDLGTCRSVEDILISRYGNTVVIIIIGEDTITSINYLDSGDHVVLDEIASNDGLTVEEFVEWFVPGEHDFFAGRIIHWTDFSYTK